MGNCMMMFPRRCRSNIRRLTGEIGVNEESAYNMILMTAALMDLRPEDDQVAHIILQDCGIEDSE